MTANRFFESRSGPNNGKGKLEGRTWSPAEAQLDAHGFLALPSADAWWLAETPRPQPLHELVESSFSFVLLAPPAAGKTYALDTLRGQEPDAVDIRPETRELGGLEAAIEAAIASGGPVYLDQLDEAALHHAQLFRVLERLLTAPEASGIRWRLACRPAPWSPTLSQQLASALPDFRELRLLPLDRESATTLAGTAVPDPERFIEDLVDARLGRLAATPGRLLAVARAWQAGEPLPAGAVDALELEISQLLESETAGRPLSAVSMVHRRRVTERLAAFTMLCGAQRYANHPSDEPGVLAVESLPPASDPEPDSPLLTPDHYARALDSALFDPAPSSGVQFRHQQYAEYLAARYLARRRVSTPQLRALIGVQPSGVMPATMSGLVAWLTSLRPDLTRGLLRQNALALLRTTEELPTDEAKAEVVSGLLEGAGRGELAPEWGVDLGVLTYDGLQRQLQDALQRSPERPEEWWWLASLAAAGNCDALVAPLVKASLDPRLPDWARSAAINAVGTLGNGQDQEKLRPLLELDDDQDPDDELLAHALRVLYPDRLSTGEMLDVLRPRRRDNLFGAYLVLLGELGEEVPDEDLPEVLHWLVQHVTRDEEDFGRLPNIIFERSWEAVEDDAVLEGLARLVVRLGEVPTAAFEWTRRQQPPWADGPARDRRRLATAVAAGLADPEDDWSHVLYLNLLGEEDAQWLVDELPGLPASTREPLSRCLPRLLRQPDAALAEQILDLPQDHPAFETTESLRGSVSLDSDQARRRARLHIDESDEPTEPPEGQLRQRIRESLDEADENIDEWWKAVYWLSHGGTMGVHRTVFSHDLTARPGWELLDEVDKRRLVRTGLRYLHEHDLDPTRWRGRERLQIPAVLPDWSGVYLMTTLLVHEPEELAQLSVDVWQTFAPAIISAWNSHSETDSQELRTQLLQTAPEGAQPALVKSALDHLEAEAAKEKGYVDPSRLSPLFPGLVDPLADRLKSGTYPDRLAHQVLDLVVSNAPTDAVSLCRELEELPEAGLVKRAREHLASIDPVATTREVVDGAVPREHLTRVIMYVDFTALDDNLLVSLAELVLDRFPMATDPPLSETSWGRDDRQEVAQVRARMLNRLVEHGQVDHLQRLAADRPEPDRSVLRRMSAQARLQAAELAHEPMTPEGLMILLARPDVRLVRTDSDLLAVVLEQLSDLQHDLNFRGAAEYLWSDAVGDHAARLKAEDTVSQWIADQLQQRLGADIILDREVQVVPQRQGIGTRVDLAATASTAAPGSQTTRVAIEAKRYDHPDLRSALVNQLVEGYLQPAELRCGIYLVYWVDPDQRPPGRGSRRELDVSALREELSVQSRSLPAEYEVAPVVLDVSR